MSRVSDGAGPAPATASIRAGVSDAWGRVGPLLGSTPTLGILVGLASWNVGFGTPAFSLDPSWAAGLYMASHSGLDFGTQIIFTWGPLGFLHLPYLYYGGLSAVAFCYLAGLHLAFCTSLVWTLRRSLNAAVACVLAFLAVTTLPDLDTVAILTLLWCLTALSADPPGFVRPLVAVGGGALAGIELLVRLTSGPLVLGVCAITLLGLPERRRNLLTLGLAFAGSFSVAWLATGQGPGNLYAFARTGADIVSGYSQAQGAEQPGLGWQFPAAAVAVAVLLSGSVLATPLPARRRVAAAGAIAVAAFLFFKEGFVRHDEFHATIFFSTAAAIALVIPWRGGMRLFGAAAVLLIGAMAIKATPGGVSRSFDPTDHLRTLDDQMGLLLHPDRRNELTRSAREEMIGTYRLDPGTLRLLRGHSIHVDPWEAGVVWAYGLDWRPEPVFQDYSAYTARLDDVNADALSSSDGPSRILRENTTLVDPDYRIASTDERFPAWDPPAAALAMLCNFAPLRTTPRWQVLGRVGDRCGEPRLIDSIDTRFGMTTKIPPPHRGEVVFARLHGAGVSGLERLRAFAYRATSRYAVFNGDSPHVYRVLPGTAADGLLLRTASGADYPRPFTLSPQARTLYLGNDSGSADPLRLDLYAMRVSPPHFDLPSESDSG